MKTYNIPALWQKACKADGINPKAKFVCFSKENKYAKLYNEAMLKRAKILKANQEILTDPDIDNGDIADS